MTYLHYSCSGVIRGDERVERFRHRGPYTACRWRLRPQHPARQPGPEDHACLHHRRQTVGTNGKFGINELKKLDYSTSVLNFYYICLYLDYLSFNLIVSLQDICLLNIKILVQVLTCVIVMYILKLISKLDYKGMRSIDFLQIF